MSRFFHNLKTTLFGSNPAAGPLQAREPIEPQLQNHAAQVQVTALRGTRALSASEVVPHALEEALEKFLAAEVRDRVRRNPQCRFRVDQISTFASVENRLAIGDLPDLKRSIRNDIALSCLKRADSTGQALDISEFCDWHIVPAADASADDKSVYTVLAGSGPERVSLSFVIYGDWDEAKTPAASTPPSPDKLSPDNNPTLDIATALMTLRVREHGQPERSVKVLALPFSIGRGSACTLTLATPYVSRSHITISQGAAKGQLLLTNNSPKITQLSSPHTRPLLMHQGQGQVLPANGKLTLAALVGEESVEISFEQAAATANVDQQATLELPTLPTPPDSAPKTPPAQGRAEPKPRPAGYLGGTPTPAAANNNPARPPSQPTLQSPSALARLWIRHGDGQLEQTLIYSTPFVIGREPEGSSPSATLRDPSARTSREHLRIGQKQGYTFVTENLPHSPGKGGSWRKGQALGPRFGWPIAPAGSSPADTSDDFWLTLGQPMPGAGTVMVRLESLS